MPPFLVWQLSVCQKIVILEDNLKNIDDATASTQSAPNSGL